MKPPNLLQKHLCHHASGTFVDTFWGLQFWSAFWSCCFFAIKPLPFYGLKSQESIVEGLLFFGQVEPHITTLLPIGCCALITESILGLEILFRAMQNFCKWEDKVVGMQWLRRSGSSWQPLQQSMKASQLLLLMVNIIRWILLLWSNQGVPEKQLWESTLQRQKWDISEWLSGFLLQFQHHDQRQVQMWLLKCWQMEHLPEKGTTTVTRVKLLAMKEAESTEAFQRLVYQSVLLLLSPLSAALGNWRFQLLTRPIAWLQLGFRLLS